jgi:DNA modification methylase
VIITGDVITVLSTLDSKRFHCCVTSPPFWGLRDYGVEGQIGLEAHPDDYVRIMVTVFREVGRVLRDDGTLWLNLGDSYAQGWSGGDSGSSATRVAQKKNSLSRSAPKGLKPKDICGLPWRVALALRDDGWYLRQDIIWSKPNPMPESVTDRCTKAHEYIFLLSKQERYYYDADAIKERAIYADEAIYDNGENGMSSAKSYAGTGSTTRKFGSTPELRNKRSVWEVATGGFSDAHFATFPPKLIEPCILAGCPRGGTVLDPFFGAGTTGLVALQNAREFVGIELNPEYVKIAEKRLKVSDTTPTMFDL